MLLVSSGKVPLKEGNLEDFEDKLGALCDGLAEDVVRNGEGTAHVMQVRTDAVLFVVCVLMSWLSKVLFCLKPGGFVARKLSRFSPSLSRFVLVCWCRCLQSPFFSSSSPFFLLPLFLLFSNFFSPHFLRGRGASIKKSSMVEEHLFSLCSWLSFPSLCSVLFFPFRKCGVLESRPRHGPRAVSSLDAILSPRQRPTTRYPQVHTAVPVLVHSRS